MSGGGRRKRILTADETALWTHVTRHIEPLSQRRISDSETSEPASEGSLKPPTPTEIAAPHIAQHKPQQKSIVQRNKIPEPDIPPLAPLEKRLRQRLSRGAHPIEAVIDLHGKRQNEAHEALRRFIIDAQRQGAAVVLVVTGKGASGAEDRGLFEERGVLRRTVPHWLRMPDLRPYVIGFEPAAQHHGGAGALYVRIRRRRGSDAS